tara:strand:+ start:388 stop:615 length:228 start_codon:yes stop_codon:yes gene_type:complete
LIELLSVRVLRVGERVSFVTLEDRETKEFSGSSSNSEREEIEVGVCSRRKRERKSIRSKAIRREEVRIILLKGRG